MTVEQIVQVIKDAEKLVASWPEWKRNILRDSAKSTVSVPRQPVVNQ